jgi:type IV pilus assembly protein PilC
MTREAMANGVVAERIEQATDRVKEGVSLSNALAETDLMPRMVIEMISVGEATGALEEMLLQVADFHEDELDLYLSRVTTWVEPALLLLMGGVIAIILIAMYLPVFHLAGAIR